MTEFTRFYASIPIGDGMTRYRTRLEDTVETTKGSVEARIRWMRLLDTFITTPELATVGPALVPDRTSISHDGIRWVVEMEAIADGGA